MYFQGCFVLVGIISVEQFEYFLDFFQEWGILYNIFNVCLKYVVCEVEIVVQVGCRNVIIIVINMVGCGIDIILGGNFEMLVKEIVESRFLGFFILDGLNVDIDGVFFF